MSIVHSPIIFCQQIQYLLIEGGMKKDTKYPINWDKSWHYHFNSLTNRTQTRSKVIYKDHTCHILIILSSLHQANLIKYEEKIRGFGFIPWFVGALHLSEITRCFPNGFSSLHPVFCKFPVQIFYERKICKSLIFRDFKCSSQSNRINIF